MQGKHIIVLPGSFQQVPLVKRLKSEGYNVTIFDPNEDAPTIHYADAYKKVDILDLNKCLTYAKEVNADAIVSDMCDIAMPTVAYLCEELGLPSLSKASAALYTDKRKMREFCQKHGLNAIEYKDCKTKEEAISFLRDIGTKCIIKPLDSNSSHGVFTIETEEDIEKHFDEALSFSKCSKSVLIERFIDGVEFTIDGVVTSKGHLPLAISEKKHYTYNKNIANELFFSNSNPNFDYNELRKENQKFVNLSGLKAGCFTHAEYKYCGGKFYLIEIGARGGGNLISSDIVPLVSGVDNYQVLIDALIENKGVENIVQGKRSNRCAVLYFFDIDHAGSVKGIQGEELLNDPKVVRYQFNFKVGDQIKKAESDSARVGYYIAYGDSKEELVSLMNKINDNLKIQIS